MFEPFWIPLRRAFVAAIVLLCHAAIAAVILFAIKGLQLVFEYLWGANDPMLYDKFPVRYLFDTMDVIIIATYIFYGWQEAARSFRE